MGSILQVRAQNLNTKNVSLPIHTSPELKVTIISELGGIFDVLIATQTQLQGHQALVLEEP